MYIISMDTVEDVLEKIVVAIAVTVIAAICMLCVSCTTTTIVAPDSATVTIVAPDSAVVYLRDVAGYMHATRTLSCSVGDTVMYMIYVADTLRSSDIVIAPELLYYE